MSDTWTTESCPHCKKKNWINHGDLEDVTIPDIEAIKCWACEEKFFFSEDVKDCHSNEVREANPDELDDEYEYDTWEAFLKEGAFCVWGRKSPDDPYRLCD